MSDIESKHRAWSSTRRLFCEVCGKTCMGVHLDLWLCDDHWDIGGPVQYNYRTGERLTDHAELPHQ